MATNFRFMKGSRHLLRGRRRRWWWWWLGYSPDFIERAFPHGLDPHGPLSFHAAILAYLTSVPVVNCMPSQMKSSQSRSFRALVDTTACPRDGLHLPRSQASSSNGAHRAYAEGNRAGGEGGVKAN